MFIAAIISIAMAAVSAIMGTISSLQSASAQANAYEFQAKQADDNARIAEQNATEARQKGIEDSRLKKMKTAAAIGEQKAALASNGVDITSGSALDAIEDTAVAGELDALNSVYEGEKTAQNYEIQATDFRNESSYAGTSAKNVKKAGYMNAFATALTGVSNGTNQFADSWYKYKGGAR